jgi:DNA-binding NtrC family response regulator
MNDPNNLAPKSPDETVILIAEDEAGVRNIVRIILESAGYFVLTGDDGEEALLISRKFPRTIHALLSDVKMPKMDGWALRDAILQERPDIKVLLMSGQVDGPAEDIPFLQKPFAPGQLIQRMRQLLSVAASGSSGSLV